MNKIKQLLTILSLAPTLCMAQSSDENYVHTQTMLDETDKNFIESVQYYNGLGYPTVSVATTGSNGETAATLTTYDALGREDRNYLPVPCSNLDIVNEAHFKSQAMFYLDNSAFTQNHYDALDRVKAIDIAGDKWRKLGKQNRTEYLANTDADSVFIYKANSTLSFTGKFYTAGSLTKEVIIDADNKTAITFKDLFGNIILQRANDGTNNLDTYYVYDDLGRLCYVLSPQYQKVGTKAINCYEYRYDDRGRIYKKKLPGCEIIQYWYDNADRVVCTQDGYMRKQSPSIARFSIYDSLGRMVIQGLCSKWNSNSTFLRDSCVVAKFDPKSEGFMGTGYILPDRFARTIKTNTILEIVNYYDGNHSKIKGSFKEHFNGVTFSYADVNTQRGQLTGSVTLAGSREAKNKEYLASVMEYDVKGNIIKSKSREIGGRIVTNTNSYTFTNNLESSKYDVDKGNVNLLSVNEILEYNGHNNKKQKSTLTITYGGNKVTSEMGYAYDALGRLDSISRPSSRVKYEYDLHGWLKKIKTNCFTEELFYADWSEPVYNCYNGNIGVIRWANSKYDLSSDKRGYKYTYDGANRLTDAVYCEYNELRPFSIYDEKMQYDANGNIIKLVRQGKTSANGWGTMDDLTITYNGNQLNKVSETRNDYNATGSFEYKKAKGSQYIYNENGSLVADKSRGIAYITYDLNNNPDSIFFTSGSMTKYVYSASGQKLRVVHYTAKPNMNKTWGVKPKFSMDQIQLKDSTDYLLGGNLVMQNGKIDKFLYEGGYAQVRPASNKFAFYYYNQDHLGNNREVVDAKGRIHERTNYYAFGMTIDESSSSIQPYKYNGKELDRMHGLDTYDYGARQYDPVLARWDRMDPLCEKYYSTSPYAYCVNNPVMFIDPDGNENIVVVGSQNNNNSGSKLMFVNQGIRAIKELSKSASSESRTMLLFKGGYTDKQIEAIRSSVKSYGGQLQILDSSSDLINYINTKTINGNGNNRASDKITQMEIYSHGVFGAIEFGYGTANADKYRLDFSNVSSLSESAFKGINSQITSYACRTGLGRDYNIVGLGEFKSSSLAQAIANSTQAAVFAYPVRTDYQFTLGTWSERRLGFPNPAPIIKSIDGASFTPHGAAHPVKEGSTPFFIYQGIMKYNPKKN